MSRPAAWPDPSDTTAVTLPSGYVLQLRPQLEAEPQGVLLDIMSELYALRADPSREARATRRGLYRELATLWVESWDLAAAEDAPVMPVCDESLKTMAPAISDEVITAVREHSEPYVVQVLGLTKDLPADSSGKGQADGTATGATKSSRSASARAPRRTSSRAGQASGTSRS